jgi:hypothetical protein
MRRTRSARSSGASINTVRLCTAHRGVVIRNPCSRAAPRKPSRGQGRGETRVPHTPGAYVHVRRSCAWRTMPNEHALGARAGRPRHGAAGTAPAPSPTGGGHPAPPPSGGRLGGGLNAANDGHRSRPCGSRRTPTGCKKVLPGRAQPSHTLPRVGAWGNPVSPPPSSRAYVHVRVFASRIIRHVMEPKGEGPGSRANPVAPGTSGAYP